MSSSATARSHTVAQHCTAGNWPWWPSLWTPTPRHIRNAIGISDAFLIKAEQSNSLPATANSAGTTFQTFLWQLDQAFGDLSPWAKDSSTTIFTLGFPQKPKGISLIAARSPTAKNLCMSLLPSQVWGVGATLPNYRDTQDRGWGLLWFLTSTFPNRCPRGLKEQKKWSLGEE